MPCVYTAGPISGQSYAGAVNWREEVATKLTPAGIRCLSPMRSKAHLEGLQHIGRFNEQHITSSQRAILCRDRYDVRSCHAVLMNLLGATQVSIGTMVEIGWSLAYDKPLVIVMDVQNPHDVHNHPFVREAADFLVGTLEEGIAIIKWILEGHS